MLERGAESGQIQLREKALIASQKERRVVIQGGEKAAKFGMRKGFKGAKETIRERNVIEYKQKQRGKRNSVARDHEENLEKKKRQRTGRARITKGVREGPGE